MGGLEMGVAGAPMCIYRDGSRVPIEVVLLSQALTGTAAQCRRAWRHNQHVKFDLDDYADDDGTAVDTALASVNNVKQNMQKISDCVDCLQRLSNEDVTDINDAVSIGNSAAATPSQTECSGRGDCANPCDQIYADTRRADDAALASIVTGRSAVVASGYLGSEVPLTGDV